MSEEETGEEGRGMVGWGCWPWDGEEADSGCVPVACCSLSPSQLGHIFAMLELCQEEALLMPEGESLDGAR